MRKLFLSSAALVFAVVQALSGVGGTVAIGVGSVILAATPAAAACNSTCQAKCKARPGVNGYAACVAHWSVLNQCPALARAREQANRRGNNAVVTVTRC